ncbi:MAG: RNA polymerase subunit sigma-70 [Eubacterium sp.]|nr:RNA polymerase subunit sigma-70 [Eubacterium sp.]
MTDKQILKDYVDACELVKETELDISKLKKKRKTIIQTNVSGSNPEFPYNPMHFKVQGMTFTYTDDQRLRYEERLLEERKALAEEIRLQAQEIINRAPVRIQRIIRFRYQEGLKWNEIAEKLGRGATEDGVRMEITNFLKEK